MSAVDDVFEVPPVVKTKKAQKLLQAMLDEVGDPPADAWHHLLMISEPNATDILVKQREKHLADNDIKPADDEQPPLD